MSIEKDYDIYIAVCDICGDDIGPFEDFYDSSYSILLLKDFHKDFLCQDSFFIVTV